jgi:hypothetical protein
LLLNVVLTSHFAVAISDNISFSSAPGCLPEHRHPMADKQKKYAHTSASAINGKKFILLILSGSIECSLSSVLSTADPMCAGKCRVSFFWNNVAIALAKLKSLALLEKSA